VLKGLFVFVAGRRIRARALQDFVTRADTGTSLEGLTQSGHDWHWDLLVLDGASRVNPIWYIVSKSNTIRRNTCVCILYMYISRTVTGTRRPPPPPLLSTPVLYSHTNQSIKGEGPRKATHGPRRSHIPAPPHGGQTLHHDCILIPNNGLYISVSHA